MKKIILLALAMLVMSISVAFADTTDDITGDTDVDVSVATVFRCDFENLATTASFTVTEDELILNDGGAPASSPQTGGSFVFSNNVPITVSVERDDWTYTGDFGDPGDFGTAFSLYLSATLGTPNGTGDAAYMDGFSATPFAITSAGDTFIGSNAGTSTQPVDLSYSLDGVDIQDRPGSYACTVLYTFHFDDPTPGGGEGGGGEGGGGEGGGGEGGGGEGGEDI